MNNYSNNFLTIKKNITKEMSKKLKLNVSEKIDSNRESARKINRSYQVVVNFLKLAE